ncbi:unnamed protein product [Cladocopium goreaui]|uniref:Uncharacterized protein n=1 Tax=Cladocopium goreaui TaxID=2562237 RepID=A0A9P1BW35_9DINO|nr:unnamed protein product [Cladocopium goreaui]
MVFLRSFIFVILLVSEIELPLRIVASNGDCNSSSAIAQATSRCQEGLVLASEGHPSFGTGPVQTHTACSCWPSFEGRPIPSQDCLNNGDFRSSTMEVQNLQTAEETHSSVLHQLPATMAKRDRPVLCAWLEADIATGPRSALQFTMAAATRLASSLELFELQRTHALAETATETKERKEDSETGSMPPLPPPPSQNMAKMPAPMPGPAPNMSGNFVPSMPTMPAPAMPKMTVASVPSSNAADAEVRGLMSMMRGRQAELPEDMQQKVQKVLTKFGQQTSTDLHAAVTALDTARQNYDDAVLARSQHHAMWKKFLSDAVQLWRTYAAQFMEQEQKLQEQVITHKESLLTAKKDLETCKQAKLGAGDVQQINSDDETEDPETAAALQASVKITETMEGLATSLQSLHQEAEAMIAEENHAAKRQRTMQPKEYNFINEFAAIENARSLAFELGTYDGISCATTSATLTHMAPSPRRSLGFASDVDVLMGLADELTMYKITVPDVCLGNGIMPWSAGLLRGGEFSNTNFDFNADQWQCLADHSPIDYANGENTAPPVAAATMFPSAGAADTNDATPGPGHHGTPRDILPIQLIFSFLMHKYDIWRALNKFAFNVNCKEPIDAQSTLVINYNLMIKILRNRISAVEFNNKDFRDKEIAGILRMFQKDLQKQTIHDLIPQEQPDHLRILKMPFLSWEEDLIGQSDGNRLKCLQHQILLRQCPQLSVDWTGDKQSSSLWMVCRRQHNFHGVIQMPFLVKLQLL